MGFILSVVAVVLIIEGIPYFAFPGRAKRWAKLIDEVPEATLRGIGLLAMLTGLTLLYFAVSTLR